MSVDQKDELKNEKEDELLSIVKSQNPTVLARKLNVVRGTVTRWIKRGKVPEEYRFELLKLLDSKIDYSKFSYYEKDQFYTPDCIARYCIDVFQNMLSYLGEDDSEYTYIEPAAGKGSFLKLFPSDRRIGIDIEPRDDEIKQLDYTTWSPPPGKYIVMGNPPFGLRGQLALKFINHSDFADYVCFILPPFFDSDGRGSPRKRITNLNLLHSERLVTDFVTPDNKRVDITCIFQIWSRHHINEKYTITESKSDTIKVYSLSDGDKPGATRNKNMFYECDIYLPSTCFGRENMKWYLCFDDLPLKRGYGVVFVSDKQKNIERCKSIMWADVAFLSTNSAYNLRKSKIIEQLTL